VIIKKQPNKLQVNGMEKLKNWDFNDQVLNCTTLQINRQKSAQNVTVNEIDSGNKTGSFTDKRNGTVRTTLSDCECNDFNFSGNSPRKKFAPCMHIYKLAMELGMFSNKYFGLKAGTPEERKERELEVLQSLQRDATRWGQWNTKVHTAKPQQERQHRGYEVFDGGDYELAEGSTAVISGYRTSLESCSCPDFEARHLPCKHIYCLAIVENIPLTITHEKYLSDKEEFERNFVPILEFKVED
jgi:hypothetical protein